MSTVHIPQPVWGLAAVIHRARTEPAYAAFAALRAGYVVLPLLMGIDKFAKVLNTDWPGYLAPWIVDLLPFSAQTAMYVVGAVEIVAAVAVAVRPRYGAYVVAAWLAGIIVTLLTYSGFYDIALRDVGLLVGALALASLATTYDRPGTGSAALAPGQN
ncbi:MAG: hypothetical protein L0H41_13075 [Microlunatus sp.]|nr:hypothetical protein [Microlunatus sp.]MDN5769928.1 hypothetical protein [Microlunatus sp.]MDN5804222.1 hypothetical protein [Microlunatus sp.]